MFIKANFKGFLVNIAEEIVSGLSSFDLSTKRENRWNGLESSAEAMPLINSWDFFVDVFSRVTLTTLQFYQNKYEIFARLLSLKPQNLIK